MSENKIGLKSIFEILEKNFYIPCYQRGYRWTRQQIEDLLNDIYAFDLKENKTKKEFYCLQPIVVRKCSEEYKEEHKLNDELKSEYDNNIWYEVIDGQQRLTTIRILLSFLVKELYNGKTLKEKRLKAEYRLEYETRIGTSDFLQKIEDSKDNIDFYHISKAYRYIEEWFSNKSKEEERPIEDIGMDILRSLTISMKNKKNEEDGIVQIIWYEIEDNINPIDTFTRINLGKIPLESGELIKGLFLKKSEISEAASQRQIEIANEWDNIENELQDSNLWKFITNGTTKYSARIELLYDIIYGSLRTKLENDEKLSDEEKKLYLKHIGEDKYATFRFINTFFDDSLKSQKNQFLTYFTEDKEEERKDTVNFLWNKVKELFLAIKEWYEDPVFYHYIGFIVRYSPNKNVIDLIYSDYKSLDKDKFIVALEKSVKKALGPIKYNVNDNHIDLLYKHTTKVRKLLLLFNLEYLIRQNTVEKSSEDAQWFTRFPFDIFGDEKWDVEHIDSYTTNQLKDSKDQIEWLNTAYEDLKDIETDLNVLKNIEEEIQAFKLNPKQELYESIKEKIQKSAGEIEEDETPEEIKNGIGNLTLLNSSINREYKNALFTTKRKKIIQKDSTGVFIPLCTKNVFLKYFDEKGTSKTKWSYKNGDYQAYESKIIQTLSKFLEPVTKAVINDEEEDE